MAREPQYILVTPMGGQLKQDTSLIGSAVKLTIVLGAMAVLAFFAWQWVDSNLLHWGVEDSRTTYVDRTELVQKLQAFEIVTIKHNYRTTAGIDVEKELRAGPARVGMPGWLAGQDMDVRGEVSVAAGVDLSALKPEDIEVFQGSDSMHVVIRIPEPVITSTEIVTGSMDIDTSQGLFTRVRTTVGLSERDLRDQAADRLALAGRQAAVDNGILMEAGWETERRLEAFLTDIARAANLKITYDVQIKKPIDL